MAINMTDEERKKMEELKTRIANRVEVARVSAGLAPLSISTVSEGEKAPTSSASTALSPDGSSRNLAKSPSSAGVGRSNSVLGKFMRSKSGKDGGVTSPSASGAMSPQPPQQASGASTPAVGAEKASGTDTPAGNNSSFFSANGAVTEGGIPIVDLKDHKDFLCDVTYIRYLRARQLDLDKAEDMLYNSLVWRSSKHPEREICQACLNNRRAHTMRVIGRDIHGRPVFYSHFAGVENRDPDDNIQHLIWMLENLFTSDVETAQQYVWLLDFQGFSVSDMNPSIGKKSLTLFSDQYPERLGKAIIMDSPWVFSGLWKILSPFIDAKTHEKISFISLDERSKLFESLLPADVIEALDRDILAVRDPESLELLDWWSHSSTSEDCPSRKLATRV
eukprot:CAMPEP_0184694426 /NCGR_PEP_ID=MMETSP0313-20130426/2394_1 /TAXON_ID=2792 /ORGANISM="Porphyridium aerugineum, Strain SAG 1380-2" /LENGTH=390 /DNA_ID=CAMNT_0027152719 /DNA_START=57 /DNA_END=1229 /DNA_ORIENTATION=+